MPGFYGHQTVLQDLYKHFRTGKVIEATLHPSDDANDDVDYTYAYQWPQDTHSGVGGSGHPDSVGTVTLWRTGEGTRPLVDMTLTINSVEWKIVSVSSRLNADEANNFAVYELSVVR